MIAVLCMHSQSSVCELEGEGGREWESRFQDCLVQFQMYPRLLFLGSRQSIYLKKRNTTLTLKMDVSEFSDFDRVAMMVFKMATIKIKEMHLMWVLGLTFRHLACALVVGKMVQFVFYLVAMVNFNMAAYSRLQNLETSISVVIRTQGFQKHIDC